MNQSELQQEWTRVIAPRTADVRTELVQEAAEFLGVSVDAAWQQMRGADDRFVDEWHSTVRDPHDAETLIEFYNKSNAELFELIEWHAKDPIHYRTLILRDLALGRSGRRYLDYGSGIGNDAIVFAEAGFDVTVADVSDRLLAFAEWRLKRRGHRVRAIDLKRESLPADTFDFVACFDVLEHIPQPLGVVRRIRTSVREGGLFVIHAPFGDDPVHPMHVVHRDVVTPRMRSLGFKPVDCWFPPFVAAPQLFEKRALPALERAGYFVYDQYLNNAIGDRLASVYRRTFRRTVAGAA